MCIKPVLRQAHVLPVELVHDVVGVEIDRRDSVEPFGFAAYKDAWTNEYHVADADDLLFEMPAVEKC
ncbi:hypothetical protein [Auritidibacter ignavus]|uniref:hypothetical protein n=1 Tax=Auritidibacter ignavus TaxID=678932 RepID=UPI003133B413